MEHVMRIPLLFGALAIFISGCAPASETPIPAASSSLGIFDVPIGQTHSQFDGVATETAFGGAVAIGAPLVAGPLSDTFYDYSVQLDASTKKIFAVTAHRVFSSMQECQKHFDSVVSVVSSEHSLSSKASSGPAWLDASSGPLSVNVHCALESGGQHPALSLSIVNKVLAVAAYENARRGNGR
jgi:hypothetical protein